MPVNATLNNFAAPVPSTFTQAKAAHIAADATDLFDDLAELKYLLSDLTGSLTQITKPGADNQIFADSSSYEAFCEILRLSKDRYADIEASLQYAVQVNNAESRLSLLRIAREAFLNLKSDLRAAFRYRGALLCAHDWEAPWHDHPLVSTNRNRLHDQIEEDAWNYKRDGHLDALEYEQLFAEEYLQHLGSCRLKSYLTSCCMAAFSTVVHWLTKELRITTPPLVVLPLYCESLILTRQYFDERIEIKPLSSADLLSSLRANNPQIVILESVTNSDEVLAYDLSAVVNWARHEARKPTFLLIDTSFLPSPLLSARLLSDLPEHVSVILIESVSKLHQFGLDVVTAGVASIDASEKHHASFKDSRRLLGTIIADASAGTLPKPNRERLVQRMQRHSRNVNLLATALENNIKLGGLIERVAWVRHPAPGTQGFYGSCLVILFRPPLLPIYYYREFEYIILRIAQEKNFPIARGQAFGYDVSRLLVPKTLCETFLLRLAVGTESTSDINLLGEVILKAVDEMENKYGPALRQLALQERLA
jgi:cystathionine beta-lyase/cystathionine gamma-synthase